MLDILTDTHRYFIALPAMFGRGHERQLWSTTTVADPLHIHIQHAEIKWKFKK